MVKPNYDNHTKTRAWVSSKYRADEVTGSYLEQKKFIDNSG